MDSTSAKTYFSVCSSSLAEAGAGTAPLYAPISDLAKQCTQRETGNHFEPNHVSTVAKNIAGSKLRVMLENTRRHSKEIANDYKFNFPVLLKHCTDRL